MPLRVRTWFPMDSKGVRSSEPPSGSSSIRACTTRASGSRHRSPATPGSRRQVLHRTISCCRLGLRARPGPRSRSTCRSAAVAGQILGSPGETTHVVIDLLAAHCKVLRPGARIVWGQNLHDGEPPLSRGRFGRLRPRLLARGLPARDLPRLIFDVHLPNDPFRRLPDESVTVVDAHLRVGPRSAGAGVVEGAGVLGGDDVTSGAAAWREVEPVGRAVVTPVVRRLLGGRVDDEPVDGGAPSLGLRRHEVGRVARSALAIDRRPGSAYCCPPEDEGTDRRVPPFGDCCP